MGKCFIAKLPAEVNNDDLPVYGKFNINFIPLNSTNRPRRGVRLAFNKDAELKVIGKGYFTNADKSQNLGTTLSIKEDNTVNSIYVSDEVSRISVDKYTLTYINDTADDSSSAGRNAIIYLQDLRYTQLTSLILSGTSVTGDISSLSNLTNLTQLNLMGTTVSGDISSLSNLTNLISLYLAGTTVSGDISSLSNLTNLTQLNLMGTAVSGDISSLSNLTNLTQLIIYGPNVNVSGDMNSISGLTKLTDIEIQNTDVHNITVELINKFPSLTKCIIPSISGDIAQVHDGISYIMLADNRVNKSFPVSWTAKSRQNKKLLCLPSAYTSYLDFGTDLDNMLIDQATCNYTNIGNYYGVIRVKGTRTSASDAALASIQNKGVTVTILS